MSLCHCFKQPLLITFCLPLLLLSQPAPAQTPPHYTVVDLGGQAAPSTTAAYAINDKTEIVGVIDGHPFLWRTGMMTLLGFNGVPKAINDKSQIVGTLDLQTGSTVEAWKPWTRGFICQNRAVHQLGILPGGVYASNARAINARGDIVGYSSTSRFAHAFLYTKGRMADLGVPPHFDSSGAVGVNSIGQIAVAARAMSTPYLKASFLWKSGKWQLLSANVSPIAINDNGDVLENKVNENVRRDTAVDTCLLWANGVTKLIGNFQPRAINDHRQIVGVFVPAGFRKPRELGMHPRLSPTVGILWESGHLYPLNALLLKAQGWQVTNAEGINNRGEIVGRGLHNGKICPVLLRPFRR